MNAVREAIIRAAEASGIDPATALAFAERESSFNPLARNSVTIRGLYQMKGDLRAKYGIGDSDDPYEQAMGWGRFFGDLKKGMSKRLGREVTDAEAYAGHHFGEGRGARMFNMDPDTPLDQVFTPREMRENPHFAKAGTVGRLMGDVVGDIDRRRSQHGAAAQPLDFGQFEAVEAPALDFGQFGEV